MKNILLTRNEFRESVFDRDNHKCVVCGEPAADAHHIIERRLWKDGGYYINNGASVCPNHHIECEQTLIAVEDLREMCGITNIIIPEHLYDDQPYDKWGNPILPNGTRLKGELFFDESVQKVLQPVLYLFTDLVKYPRTYHLPWSQGITDDDRMMDNLTNLHNKRIIITEKMDGENYTFYKNDNHARSVDGRSHPSRSWVKNIWGTICHEIPDQWRICGENLYAKHSIYYTNLISYFIGFSIWNEYNECLGWDDTLEWFNLLDIHTVPVLYDGIFDIDIFSDIWNDSNSNVSEGYVVRIADKFSYKDFRYVVGKFVRKNHVKTVKHWMYGQPIVPNLLRK